MVLVHLGGPEKQNKNKGNYYLILLLKVHFILLTCINFIESLESICINIFLLLVMRMKQEAIITIGPAGPRGPTTCRDTTKSFCQVPALDVTNASLSPSFTQSSFFGPFWPRKASSLARGRHAQLNLTTISSDKMIFFLLKSITSSWPVVQLACFHLTCTYSNLAVKI